MRPLTPSPEPATFDRRVRLRGNRWLARRPAAKPSDFPDYWNEFREELQTAFAGCCAYPGFPIPSGQIDHFVAKSRDRTKTYEWSNCRWGEPRVNQLKSDVDFLDPFTLQSGWVIIDPVTLEYRAGADLPPHLHDIAETTFNVPNDPELLRGRRWMLQGFRREDGSWDVPKLRLFFPLLADSAEAFDRQHRAFLAARQAPADSPGAPLRPADQEAD
jgi:hypothetical protein